MLVYVKTWSVRCTIWNHIAVVSVVLVLVFFMDYTTRRVDETASEWSYKNQLFGFELAGNSSYPSSSYRGSTVHYKSRLVC